MQLFQWVKKNSCYSRGIQKLSEDKERVKKSIGGKTAAQEVTPKDQVQEKDLANYKMKIQEGGT